MTHEQGFDGGNTIDIFDQTLLFDTGSDSVNQQYMFHAMDATIGTSTGALWLFSGTGNYERMAEKKGENLLLGINDRFYPNFRVVPPARFNHLSECSNTTDDTTGAQCPKYPNKRGWYIELKDSKKVTAEPTVGSGLVAFPIYKPVKDNLCGLGDAFICAVDDECGTNVSSQLGENPSGVDKNEKCKYVGKGVLSKIVIFANQYFANIAGETNTDLKDLVVIESGVGDVTTYRNSWRSNY